MGNREMTAGTAARLLAAKQCYTDGDRLKDRGDDAGRIQAALLMDQAVETALKTTLSHAEIEFKKGIRFPDLVEKAASRVPSARDFGPCRKIRNRAQHDGVAPTLDQLRTLGSVALGTLVEAVAACGGDYYLLTMERFVVNPTTLDLLARSRSALSEPQTSALIASRGLRWVRHMAKHLIAEARSLETWESYNPLTGVRTVTANADGRGEMIATLLDGLVTAGLGFDLAEEIRATKIVGSERDSPVTEAEALWLIDYLARHAYRLERALPGLQSLSPEETGPTAELADSLPLKVTLPSGAGNAGCE